MKISEKIVKEDKDMENKAYSYTTNKYYDIKKCVRVGLPKLQALYLKHNVPLYDVYYTDDLYSGEPVVIMLFDKEKSKPLYELWQKHELK